MRDLTPKYQQLALLDLVFSKRFKHERKNIATKVFKKMGQKLL